MLHLTRHPLSMHILRQTTREPFSAKNGKSTNMSNYIIILTAEDCGNVKVRDEALVRTSNNGLISFHPHIGSVCHVFDY